VKRDDSNQPALLGELGGWLGRWAKGAAKTYNCVVQKVTNECYTKKGMMKVNETHVHAVYEKIKVLHYFRFAAEVLIFSY